MAELGTGWLLILPDDLVALSTSYQLPLICKVLGPGHLCPRPWLRSQGTRKAVGKLGLTQGLVEEGEKRAGGER